MKILKSLALIGFIGMTMMSCTRVAPNYQGVLMENFGQNGKTDFTLVLGRVNTMAMGTELFQVPLFEQRAGFENATDLKAADNTGFKSKPSYSYAVIKERSIDVVFQNKQLGSGEEFMKALEDNILEPKIYDIMKEASRKFSTDSLMSNGGSLRYEKYVEELVAKEFENRGLSLKTFSSQLEFSKKVTDKIDNRNEVNTNISVIDQQIEEQRKRNTLADLQVQEAIIRSRGLTPQILEEQAIAKWSGVLPTTIGGNSIPFIKSIK